MLAQTDESLASTTLEQFCNESCKLQEGTDRLRRLTLHEQRQESDEEHQEDRHDTVLDPVEHRNEVVAPILARKNIALGVNPADGQLLVKRTEIEHYNTG